MVSNSLDKKFMLMALSLAQKAKGRTSPNPMVGAVVVKSGKVISTGFHHRAGEPHAEAIALRKAGSMSRGATLYVTLEPCSHTNKRTPPCVPLVMQSGIKRVVVAMIDPNPRVSGGGIRALRKAGISVVTGVLKQESLKLNEAFVKYITRGVPFVTLKIAQTLDGKIATSSGESQWITGKKAREEGHRLRDANDAILVGINTILRDNPSLTTRILNGRDPVRVILDSRLRIPLSAKVITQKSASKTIMATLATAARTKIKKLLSAGVDVLLVKPDRGRVDLHDLMVQLGKREIISVLVEGGAEVHASALKAGIADKVVLFVAPMLMTGADSLCAIGGISPARLSKAIRLRDLIARFVGEDIMVEGYIR